MPGSMFVLRFALMAIGLCCAILGCVAAPAHAVGRWLPPVGLSYGGQGLFEPQVAIGSQGNAAVVWNSFSGAYDTIELATKSATGSWQGPGYLSAPGQIGGPQIAVDSLGNTVVVWSRLNDDLDGIVQATTKPASGPWQPPVNLSAPGENASKPQVATDPLGNTVVVWERIEGVHSIVQAATKPAGGAWQGPVNLTGFLVSGEGAFDPQVAIDAQGNAVAAWWRSGLTQFVVQAATKPVDGAWEAPVTLSVGGQNAILPQVATDPQGSITVVWDRRPSTSSVQAATKPAGGIWQAPADISPPGQSAIEPQVVADAQGNAVAAWKGPNEVVQTAMKPTGGFSWQAPVTLSVGGQSASKPQVAVGLQGSMVVVWVRGGIVQTSTKSAGGTWQAPVAVSVSGQNASNPQVAVDSLGNAVAVWERGSIVQAAAYDAGGLHLLPASWIVGQPLDLWAE